MIKQLDKKDWQNFREIRLEALKKSSNSFLSSFEEENKKSDEFWLQQLEQSLKFGYFLNNEIVACCGLSLEKSTKISHTATIFQMYVKDKMRKNGIGLALVNFVKDFAKNNGIIHLYLGCNAENFGAIRLYRKCGFKVYGTRPNYTKIGDKFYDDLIMMCEL